MMYVFLRRRDRVFCLKKNTNYRVSSRFLPFGKAGVGLPGSGLSCPKAPSGSPWVGGALSESPEWVSPGRGCLVRKSRMGLLGSGVPCPKAPNGSPWVGGALSEGSERASFVQNESPQTCGKGFCAPNESSQYCDEVFFMQNHSPQTCGNEFCTQGAHCASLL